MIEPAVLIVVLAIVLSLIIGIALGWLSRAATLARATAIANEVPDLRLTVETLRSERDQVERKLAGLQPVAETVERLRVEYDVERRRCEALSAENAAYVRGEEERDRAHSEKLAQLKEMETKLEARFGELASAVLANAQGQFLKRAEERFRQSEEKSGDSLKALLQPVSERLQRYEDGVAKIERERTEAYGTLTGLIGSMRDGQERVQAEAARLVNSLRSAPKTRGRWGEQQLRNVLEICGLAEHADFETEVSVDAEDGRLRPDVVVRIPGGRTLVVDAKVSLNAFQDAHDASEDAQRLAHLRTHAAAMKAHVNKLGAKSYQSIFAENADYVIMFVPGEHFLSAALDLDPKLWDYALDQKVLLATPTNLIAIARTVAAVWRQEKLAADARRIAELGKELHERLVKVAVDMKRVGGGLATAVNNYNTFVGSFESRALVTARKFRDLNIETGGRDIEQVSPVEVLTRYGDEMGTATR